MLEGVVKARAAVAGDRTAAPEFIETLGAHLNMLLLKGGLVLHGSELGER